MKNPLSLLFFFLIYSTICAQVNFPKRDVYQHESGQKVAVPDRHLAFVDVVDSLSFQLKKETLSIIGEPNFNPKNKLSTSLSLPPNESVVLRFVNNKIRNIKGKDLCVFNIGEMNKLELWLEIKKGTWQSIGFVSNENPYLFLDEDITKDLSFTRLKLLNTSQNTVIIDAVAAIGMSKDRQTKKLTLEDYRIFTTNTYITIKFKDYRQWDGDKIKITVNGETIIKKTFLAIWWKKVKIALQEGENSINIVALNNGFIRPNTVKFRLLDGEKQYDTLIKLRKRTQKTIFVERG